MIDTAVDHSVDAMEWPVIGREEETRQIISALRTPLGPGVLITGEPGVGKTRLLDHVLDRCAEAGTLIVRGAATEATRNISGLGVAGLHIVGRSSAAAGHGLSGLSRVLDEARRGASDGCPTAGRILLCIDDIEHIDAASAAVVGDLVRTTRVTLLLTARAGSRLDGRLAHMYGEAPLMVLRLANLSRAVVLRLLTRVLGGPVDGLTADVLWRISRGNPLLLRRVVGIGLDTGDLSPERGVWSWREAPGKPPRLHGLVAADLATLSAAESEALEYVALTGLIPRVTAEHLAGSSTISELVDRAVVAITSRAGADAVVMSHALQREALMARLGLLRRRQRYRQLVAAAAETGVPDRDDPATVLWRLEAGLDVPVSQAVVASRLALASGDPVLAENLAQHVHGSPGSALRGQALIAQGRAAEAERLLADHGGDGAETVALRSLNLFWGLNRPAEAQEEMARALPSDAARSADLGVAELGLALFTRTAPLTGGAQARESVPFAETTQRPAMNQGPLNPLVADAATVLRAYQLTFRGRPAQAAEDFDRGSLQLPARWPAMRGSAAACHVNALILAGKLRQAFSLVEIYYEEAIQRAEPSEVAIAGQMRGHCWMWEGRPSRALAPLREARALVDEHTPFPLRVFIGCEYAVCLAALGRPREAFEELGQIRALIPRSLSLHERLEFSRIRLLAYSGRPAHAAELANRLADLYLRESRLTTGVECAYYHVRLRPSHRAAARLREAAEACDSPLFALFAAHGDALVARNGPVLRELAEGFAELGYAGLALEAAQAMPGGGHAARRYLNDLADRCDGYRPPWLPPISAPLPSSSGNLPSLTSREREMCELAAAGLSNSAIAANLGISVRTVTNLLGRAYHKLGIHDRRQLADALLLSP
ncbi:LuxR family transcriptional regulator [Microtetraspora niveoalba]|uniref:LuxR family transcriptional regulator n=1 Tax=Microtetraspora niveoalba TaxID=46175 RepID=UPI00082DDE12|nr:LuxR family transcriptional regulator [Microtetraspora niveoalba]